MENNPTWMPVVALALRDGDGRLLLQKRPDHKHHGGLWEFPGGKVETYENPRLALVREIAEELGIAIESAALEPSLLADEPGPGRVVLFLYKCDRWQGEVTAKEGQDWGWFTLSESRKLALAPLDRDFVNRLGD